MAERDARRLRSQVEAALARGKLKEAIDLLERLERVDPSEPRWSQRLGDTHRRLDQTTLAISAYGRAVDRFARAGLVARAIAMARTIAMMEPGLREANVTGRRTIGDGDRELASRPLRRFDETVDVSRVSIQFDPRIERMPEPESDPYAREPAPGRSPPPRSTLHLTMTGLPAPDGLAPEILYPDIELSLDDPARDPEPEPVPPQPQPVAYVEQRPAPSPDPAPIPPEQLLSQKLAVLAHNPSFAQLPQAAVQALAVSASVVRTERGEHAIRTGDPADALFLIAEGSVRAMVLGSEAKGSRVLRAGEIYGEKALLSDEPQPADVIVEERLTALRIPKPVLTALASTCDPLQRVLVDVLAKRLLVDLFRSSTLLSRLDVGARRHVVRAFELRDVTRDTIIVAAGEPGHGLYISVTSTIEVIMRDGTTRVLPPGTSLGQASLVSRDPVEYTVRILEDGVLLHLSSERFTQVMQNHADAQRARAAQADASDARSPRSATSASKP